jgi:magnesium transporter
VKVSSINNEYCLSIQRSRLFPESYRERLRIVLKDISSLTEYTTFNFERLEYLQDTFTGLINLEQNQIIKIFTVVTIVFLPTHAIRIFGIELLSHADICILMGSIWH